LEAFLEAFLEVFLAVFGLAAFDLDAFFVGLS
jgi:hypothetical protein